MAQSNNSPTREQAIEMLRGWRDDVTKPAVWDYTRRRFPNWQPDLSRAKLTGQSLRNANLSRAILYKADLRSADLGKADLSYTVLSSASLTNALCYEANFTGADLSGAFLSHARLQDAKLIRANLYQVDLSYAMLIGADFSSANLEAADIREADLRNTNLTSATLRGAVTEFTKLGFLELLQLSDVDDLKQVRHDAPSSIDTHTLKAAKGRLPDEFLRGIGLEKWEVELAKLYDPCIQGNDFVDRLYRIYDMREKGPIGGVFISYSSADEAFVDKVDAALRARDINTWRDKHDLRSGPLVTQIVGAIRRHDVVLLVLSKASLGSDWVAFETEHAREREMSEGRTILCPITIDNEWEQARGQFPAIAQLARDRYISKFDPVTSIDHGRNAEEFRKLIEGMKLFYRPPAA